MKNKLRVVNTKTSLYKSKKIAHINFILLEVTVICIINHKFYVMRPKIKIPDARAILSEK